MKKTRSHWSVPTIAYEGPGATNALAFRHYNPDELIDGKTMSAHMRFSIAYWHSFRGTGSDPFGPGTILRPWEKGTDAVSIAKVRMDAAFEFFQKIRAPFWCFHDRDIAPEGSTLAQSNKNLDAIVAHAKDLQKATGVKLLWGTANLFSNPRFMCGASTNPDAHVFAYAAAQVKQAIDVTKILGGENYVFWGGREGYETLLNTNLKREQDHLAAFLHMAVDYAKSIGFKGQFLIEPKPKEPTKHQYDYDSATVIGFLNRYGLQDDFKLNIEVNHATLAGHTFQHELQTAVDAGMLGSIDANRGDSQNGWDTDQFPMHLNELVESMLIILEAKGFAGGGVNFDAKTRRNSTDMEDIFHAHIGGMDAFARALVVADNILQKSPYSEFRKNRYASFDAGEGKLFEEGKLSLEDLRNFAFKAGEPKMTSGRQEWLENIINQYI